MKHLLDGELDNSMKETLKKLEDYSKSLGEDIDSTDEKIFADMGLDVADPANTFASSGNPVPLQIKKHRAYAAGYNALSDGHYPAKSGDNAPMEFAYD